MCIIKSISANTDITKTGGRQNDQNNIKVTETDTVGGEKLWKLKIYSFLKNDDFT